MTFYIVTLARTIWLPDDGPRTETCWSVFNVLMCKFYKFYICAVFGIIIERLNNMHGVTTKIHTVTYNLPDVQDWWFYISPTNIRFLLHAVASLLILA